MSDHKRLPVGPADIRAAQARLAPYCGPFLRETPLWRLPGAVLGVDCAELWLKLEHMQVGGSFKARGMLNRLLAHAIGPAGVVVASGGNAGIATAAAAAALGVRCEVFLPELSTPAKQARLRAMGAHVRVHGAAYPQALAACLARQRETGALMTHAYDQEEVVAGAGTLAAEMEVQAGGLPDALLVSVGGGGLIAGVAAWVDSRSTVVGLESEGTPTLHRARAAGEPVEVSVRGLAADSLGAARIGQLAWPITQVHVQHSLLVSDEAIREAQLTLWRECKLLVEPAAALGLAALRSGAWQPQRGDRVGLILCGANVDPASLG